MKAVVAFLLAGLVLGSSWLPGFSVDQSAKLVDLAGHYHEHRQTEPDLSFIEFMVMHYGADSEHQKHPNHSHQNLPAVGHSMTLFTPVLLFFTVQAAQSVLLLTRSACFRYANLYSFLPVASLINPPRR